VTDNKNYLSIGIVERDTGIGRDTLRVWERRYGFPKPERNQKGERVYTEIQLRRLQRIRRLLERGLRPGKLLRLSDKDLDDVEASLRPEHPKPLDESVNAILEAVQSGDAGGVEHVLDAQLKKRGMRAFIVDTVVPLLNAVGERWVGGTLQVFQEHFLSEQLIRFLNTEITRTPNSPGKPVVVLATLPGEEHTLGLLMVAAMLSNDGVPSINLGGEVPMDQINQAVRQFQADVVGITFSGAYAYKNIRADLLELRALLPTSVEIWTGGEGVRRLRKLPAGINRFKSLEGFSPPAASAAHREPGEQTEHSP